MNIIEAKDVTKTYTIGGRQIPVLDNISLGVTKGEYLVIEGSSGSGKTTLLSLLSGLDKPSAGSICIASNDITDTPEDELAPLRNEMIGFVFQAFHLVPSLSAIENVMFPAELKHDPHAYEKAQGLLDRIGLGKRIDNFPHQLSGGEMQRVAMCRALINDPEIIFADEPTGNLDSENGKAILDLLLEFHRERYSTLVLVTHNIEIAKMADRMIVLHDGRIVEDTSHDHQLTA
ncbi:MAG: ABC transporter ATP-binding protein [Desulfobacterales bacterium]|jgi:putative ABC transport system ATP-binding protein